MTLYNRVRAVTATTGNGSIVLGEAVSSYRSFTVVANGATVPYAIEDGNAWETGTGTWTSATSTLTRTLEDSSTGSLLSLSGRATVFITPTAASLFNTPEITCPLTLNSSAAAGAQVDALRVNFAGSERCTVAQQATGDQHPGSGIVEVHSADGRTLQMTHYQYGGAFRGLGANGAILECQLGELAGGLNPNFSVRGYDSLLGAIVQARNGADTSGVRLDFTSATRPKVTVDDNAFSPDELSIEHPRATGYITIRANSTECARFAPATWTHAKGAFLSDTPFLTGFNVRATSGALAMGTTGANVIGFFTNNLERMRVADTGHVGIGTDNPVVELDVDGPARVKSYTVAGVPAANIGAGQIIYVSNETGGAVLAFSDGTDWRRVTDRAVVS